MPAEGAAATSRYDAAAASARRGLRRPDGVSAAVKRVLPAVALLAAGVVSGVLIASRTVATSASYVALGDSYSSGIGAERYASDSGACLRSPQSYVHRLERRISSFRACGGATTGDVLRRQLGSFPGDTRLVTITIGGNDAGFGAVLDRCLFGARDHCERHIRSAERFVRRGLSARLRRVYAAIRERAPRATVVVAGYPRLFARRPWCGPIGTIDEREQRRLNEGADLLARTTAAEVRRHRGFRFVDVREDFDDHAICSRTPRIHGVTAPRVNSFHPTVAGYATYARAIRRAL